MNKKVIIGVVSVVVVLLVAGGILALTHKKGTSLYSNPYSSSSSNTNTYSSTPNKPATVNNSVVSTKSSASEGEYLVTASGKALYTYGSDTSGVSNCTGSCLTNWPAYVDTGATTGLPTNIGVIKRTDDNSVVQYTYKGMPLYTFASDTSSDQPSGGGVAGFSIAKP